MHFWFRRIKVVFFLFLFLSIRFSSNGQYYRTISTGFWNNAAIWEVAQDAGFSIGLSGATQAPDENSGTITIRNGHAVYISQSVSINEVVVELGGMLVYANYAGSVLTISDGPGVDLQVNGTFEDTGPFNINWISTQASWALGNSGTMIRTRSTSAALWRDHYENGMSTIPASSTWIIRKQNADQPSISGVDTWYGNLIIENVYTTFWNANVVGSKITGINSAPVIKGNFEIGRYSTYGLKFYSQNSFADFIKVQGNMLIATGSEFVMEDATSTTGASGIDLKGDLEVNGILSYDISDVNDQNRILKFSGITDQRIKGIGNILMYHLVNQKNSGSLMLEKDVVVDYRLSLLSGELLLNEKSLIIQNGKASAIERIDGWIRSENDHHLSKILWNIGTESGEHIYPFGRDAGNYIPCSISVTNGNVGTITVSTYGTGNNNLPYPILQELVTNLEVNSQEYSAHTVDRFWYLHKSIPSGTTQIVFRYCADEKPSGAGILQARRYSISTDTWEEPLCCQVYDDETRRVIVSTVQDFSNWTLMEEPIALDFQTIQNTFIENNFYEEQPIYIYPSPVKEECYLNYVSEGGNIQLEITNTLGVIVFREELETVKGLNKIQIDLSSIEDKGLLILSSRGNTTIQQVKIMKE